MIEAGVAALCGYDRRIASIEDFLPEIFEKMYVAHVQGIE
jgi:hypothetical protein